MGNSAPVAAKDAADRARSVEVPGDPPSAKSRPAASAAGAPASAASASARRGRREDPNVAGRSWLMSAAQSQGLLETSSCCCNVTAENCAAVDFLNDAVVEVYMVNKEDPWSSDPSVMTNSLGGLFKVLIDRRGGEKLGLDVDPDPGQEALLITGVNSGLVEQWNRKHPSKALKIGDRLMWVNGISGDPEKLVAECRKFVILNITAETAEDPFARPNCSRVAPCLLPCTGLSKVS